MPAPLMAWGGLLADEVVHPQVGAVPAELLGGHGQVDGLVDGLGGGGHEGVRAGLVVAEGGEADADHGGSFESRGGARARELGLGVGATGLLSAPPAPAVGGRWSE
jgi:hypothetical protein